MTSLHEFVPHRSALNQHQLSSVIRNHLHGSKPRSRSLQQNTPDQQKAGVKLSLRKPPQKFVNERKSNPAIITSPPQCFTDANIQTICRKQIHIKCSIHDQETVYSSPVRTPVSSSSASSSSSSVKPFVPLLSPLENHSSHYGAHHDPQQGAQQQQEHLPAGERRAAEVSGGIIDVV